jgi:Mrp family chromosome partitioning ATPase
MMAASLGIGQSVLCRRLISSTRLRSLSAAINEVPAFVLSHPSTVDDPSNNERGRVVCVTSGKGGVGKTTASASFALGLASKGHSTCVVDFDIGLRNLDLHLGMERRVIFDMVNVLLEECSLHQALLKDRRQPNLSLLAASQTHDKDVLTVDGVERILAELTESFDYVGMYFIDMNESLSLILECYTYIDLFRMPFPIQFWIHPQGLRMEPAMPCTSVTMPSLSPTQN